MTKRRDRKKTPDGFSVNEASAKGAHNQQNSMAASITGKLYNLRSERMRESLQSFENSEHRIERYTEFGNIEFINDSKATNVAAAWYALDTMTRPVIWIAGGKDKGNDYGTLLETARSKVKVLVAMGPETDKLRQAFEEHIETICVAQDMRQAVRMACERAEAGDVVLLSPACASFDLYDNYEARGESFKAEVDAYIEERKASAKS